MGSLVTYILCISVLVVLLIGNIIQSDKSSKPAKYFTLILLAAISFFVVSLLTEMLDGRAELSNLLYVLNLTTFPIIDLMIIAFSAYFDSLLSTLGCLDTKVIKVATGLSLARIVIVFFLSCTGKIFMIENGFYVEKEFSSIPYTISFIIMFCLLAVVIKYRRCFTNRQLFGILFYLLFPAVPIIFETFTDLYALTSVGITISILVLYVLIVSTTIQQSKVRESVLEDILNTDLLTGLNNRRRYYDFVGQLEDNENVGVIFCDMNGLKYTNDHFGHGAGDTLIQKFATLLTNAFKNDCVFRISGDEFVVIIPAVNRTYFEKRVNSFKDTVKRNNDIASIGSSYGVGYTFERLVNEAENEMYEEKEIYHENND